MSAALYQSIGVGRIKTNELDLIGRPYSHPINGTRTAVLVGLPHGYDPPYFQNADEITDLAASLKCVLVPGPASPAAGKSFGNDAALDSFDKAWTYATGTLGCRSDRVFLLGMSMGGLPTCNWARTHTSIVKGIALVTPAVDLQWVHDLNGTYTTEVDAAYTNHSGFLAAKSTHSPVDFAASIASIPVRIWYSTDDTMIPLVQAIQPFVDAHGNSTLVNMGAIGHNPSGAAGSDLAAWMDSLG